MTPGKVTKTIESFSNTLSSLKNSNIFSLNFSPTTNYQSSFDDTQDKPDTDPQDKSFNLPVINNQPTLIPTIQGHSRSVLENDIREIPNRIIPRFSPIPIIISEEEELLDFPVERGDMDSIPQIDVKPTKKPKSSPTPLAPPQYLRPGTGLEDIFKKAGELACVPPALLKAFVAQEASGVLNWSDQTALFYNAYDWWHRVKDKTQVCAGYGYYTHTGLVAEDSLFAGEKCKDPFSPETANDTYSRLLGSCQMLRSYWEKDFKESTRQKLKVSKVDRRVLIDCLIGYGIHFRQDTGYSGSCNGDWEMKYVAKAACVNAGGNCDQYNYCTLICNNYNKYGKKNYNCNSAAGLFVPGSYCQFK